MMELSEDEADEIRLQGGVKVPTGGKFDKEQARERLQKKQGQQTW